MLIYFLFFGFGRPQFDGEKLYRYSLMVTRIPLWLPQSLSVDTLQRWVFSFGNLAAFMPFGFLVPHLFQTRVCTYFQVIGLFLVFILSMELLQMVTYLGSFDAEDVLINTLGMSIGFCAYKVSKKMKSKATYWGSMAGTVAGLTLLVYFIAVIFNRSITPLLEKIFGL